MTSGGVSLPDVERLHSIGILSIPTLHPIDVTPRLRRRPLTGALNR